MNYQKNFSAWLDRVCADEVPPQSIAAFYIGLFETPQGYSAYLIGTGEFDDNDSDWACDESFTPKERYFPFSGDEFNNWEGVLAATISAAKDFLQSPAGRESFLGKGLPVAVGFDDGDLVRVK